MQTPWATKTCYSESRNSNLWLEHVKTKNLELFFFGHRRLTDALTQRSVKDYSLLFLRRLRTTKHIGGIVCRAQIGEFGSPMTLANGIGLMKIGSKKRWRRGYWPPRPEKDYPRLSLWFPGLTMDIWAKVCLERMCKRISAVITSNEVGLMKIGSKNWWRVT